jgi:RNA polymerase sigma-70 factor (ECF subfamily)
MDNVAFNSSLMDGSRSSAAAHGSSECPEFRDMFSGVGPTSQPQPATQGSRTTDNQSWSEYLGAIQNGNAEALAKLYDATSKPLYSLALRILGNAADAEEVLLDVYQQIWRAAGSFDPGRGGVWNWLILLTRSRALDRLRNTANKRQHEVAELPDQSRVASSAPVPEQASILAEQGTTVRRAICTLPPEQREALELAYFRGLTHIEIAARLGVPLGTIKTRIRSAMDKLRVALQASSGEMSRQ